MLVSLRTSTARTVFAHRAAFSSAAILRSEGAPSGHGQDSFNKRERGEEERYARENEKQKLEALKKSIEASKKHLEQLEKDHKQLAESINK